MAIKFDPRGDLMINDGLLIGFHLYCCSKHKLSTIILSNVADLARFVK